MRVLAVLFASLLVASCGEKPAEPEKRQAPRYRPGTEPQVVQKKRITLKSIVNTMPRDDYERALFRVLYRAQNPEALQHFCVQWYPDSGRAVADAYKAWQEKNAAVLQELKDRSTEIWTEYAEGETKYVRYVYGQHLRDIIRGIEREFDESPAEKFKRICANFPNQVKEREWDVEKHNAKDLKEIRKRPLKAASQQTTAQAP